MDLVTIIKVRKMSLSNLKPAAGATKGKRRIGRGQGSGYGGTSTRGHKGAKSRSGYKAKFGFEGGQMPLQRRVPKFGFTSPNRVEYRAINLDVINTLASEKNLTEVTLEDLIQYGHARKSDLIKVLGRGELNGKVSVHAHAFSNSAKEAIEKAGGEVHVLNK